MNRDDIIRMARAAGCHDNGEEFRFVELHYLERFAHLVTILDAAVLEEREACAKVCSEFESEADPDAGFVLAAAIRARSNP